MEHHQKIDTVNICKAVNSSYGCGNVRVVKQSTKSLVLEDDCYFYKIRRADSIEPSSTFAEMVIRAFIEEYSSMGVDWVISEHTVDGSNFYIEKMEKLERPNSKTYTIEALKRNFVKTKESVEKRLGLPSLFVQLRKSGFFDEAYKLTLAYNTPLVFDDFALHGENALVLGNYGWFLALMDANGKWIRDYNNQIVSVSVCDDEFYFTRDSIYDLNRDGHLKILIEKVSDISPSWWLFPKKCGNLDSMQDYLLGETEKMLKTNVAVVCGLNVENVKTKIDYADIGKLIEAKEESNIV